MLGVVHGWVVQSEWKLPHLVPVESATPPDLVIARRTDARRPHPGQGPVVAAMHSGPHRHQLVEGPDGGFCLTVPGVLDATFDASVRRAEVVADPGADPMVVAMVIGGLVLSFALLLRGEQVLHASAVEQNGEAVAVLGSTGSGKSTVAAMLCLSGGALLSDDQLRVGRGRSGGAVCWRSARWLRARATGLGPAVVDLVGSIPTADGRAAVALPTASDLPTPLVAVIHPVPDATITQPVLHRLRGAAAFAVVAAARPLPGTLEQRRETVAFAAAVDLAERLPVWSVRVPWIPEQLVETGGMLWAGLSG